MVKRRHLCLPHLLVNSKESLKLGIVTTTAAPAVNQFFYRICYYNQCFRLIFWFFCNWLKIIFGGTFTNKHSMTLKRGACILNYSRAVLTDCPRITHFGLLFFKVSLRTQTYFRLSLDSGDKRQPEIGLRLQATSRWDEKKKNKANLCKFWKIDNRVNKTVTPLQQLEIILPVLLLWIISV